MCDPNRVRACIRKQRYSTKSSAKKKGMVVYHCVYCDGYHQARDKSRARPFNIGKKSKQIKWIGESRGNH